MALLGIAGGLLVTPGTELRADQDDEFLSGLMAAGCGKSGCSHQNGPAAAIQDQALVAAIDKLDAAATDLQLVVEADKQDAAAIVE